MAVASDGSAIRRLNAVNVWKTIKGPDGASLFLGSSANKEIRIGVTLSLDW
jgi:hypothetical protein